MDSSVKRIFTTQKELAVTFFLCSVNETEIGNKSYTRDVRSPGLYGCCLLCPHFREIALHSGGKSTKHPSVLGTTIARHDRYQRESFPEQVPYK
jgi:hypothetical protein